MTGLEAIPEMLFGMRFRSRLEARWAIFLRALDLAFEYEPAPFQLDGRPRWPDFWLADLSVWCEVKPAGVPPDVRWVTALQEESGSPCLWLAGEPWPGKYEIYLCDFGGLDIVDGLVFALSRRGGEAWLAARDMSCALPLPPRGMLATDDFPRIGAWALREAYRAAMGYRFEGGGRG